LTHFPGLDSLKDMVSTPQQQQGGSDLELLERNYIAAQIERSGGDVEKAAHAMGYSRATLYRKLKKFRISP
jgi:DNA-binding NtrC family response regulator